ncbi:hypothetical protein [Marinitoga sp. 38H-ov]|uniref:hypothetical protein n=1 Tax=Marinitoga sp. 38H-ov TaxID=1755814 RepID=UPI0013ECAB2E|nr:hypothetical protein [Marinitoga sp. 38H-ov]KAF2956143.1 hypothetical protein AS160_07180 [Marinitoga sp. 38H-ov]
MKSIFDIFIEKLIFKRLKSAYYTISDKENDDFNFYFINLGVFNKITLKDIFFLISTFKNNVHFKLKLGLIVLKNFRYIKYISEIAEIFDIKILVLYNNEFYLIQENNIKKINNNDYIYFKTTKLYFLTNSSQLLYQIMDIRLEDPHFIIFNKSNCDLNNLELNSISTALSNYLISIDYNNIISFKPENNNQIEYKTKEHFILKFSLKNLEKIKNGITKFDKKKIELLIKHI